MNENSTNDNTNNNEKKVSPVTKFLAGKGFYIVLFLCVAAIGISGYIVVSNTLSNREDATDYTLSAVEDYSVNATEETMMDSNAASYLDDAAPVMAENSPAPETEKQEENTLSSEDALNQAAAEAAAEAAKAILVWPVEGQVTHGYSTDALAYSETMSDWRIHNGTDIEAVLGAQVMAITSGTVTDIYNDEYLGTTVVLEHPGDVVSVYSNLMENPPVSIGDEVMPGTVIGSVGESALGESAQGPHLHLEIYQNGESIDPLEYLP